MKLGNRIMYFSFGFFVLLGQVIFAYGCDITSMEVMLIGRGVYGLGGEGLGLCASGLIVKWFYLSEIGLPLGLMVSISKIGSVLNSILSPIMSNVS